MRGIPNMDSTQMFIHADRLVSHYSDVVKVAPQLKDVSAVKLDKVGKVDYVGDFKGRYLDFQLIGKDKTDKGDLDINSFYLNMMGNHVPEYGGDIVFRKLNLSEVIPNIPIISGSGSSKFKASGFDFDQLKMEAKGHISNGSFDTYVFNDIGYHANIANEKLDIDISTNGQDVQGDFNFAYSMKESSDMIVNGTFRKIDFQFGTSNYP